MRLNKTLFISLAMVGVSSIGLISPAIAQSETATAVKATQAEPPKRDQRAVDYEKTIKDLQKFDGAFTIYLRKKDVLAEIGEDKLGKIFCLQGSFHHGFSEDPVQAGSPIGGNAVDVFRFDKADDSTVWLVRPNLSYRWDSSDPLGLASERSFPKAILDDFRIEGYNPETKKYLINISSFMTGDLQQLPMMITILGGGQYSLDRDKSGVDKVIQGGDITTIRMNLTYNGRPSMGDNPLAALLGMQFVNQAEDPRSMPLKVTWSMWFRDENSTYMPRVADPRVGYFTQDFWSVDRFYRRDRTQRYINRWNLEKKDPKAAVSEPVKPIVWTLDPSIPAKFRPAFREGVMRWNKAFDALGYKNAVQVVEADPKDKDYDHADARRNVIRLTMTQNSAYAIALFRTDPFTGEIHNASVNLDANFLHYVNQEFLRSVIPTTAMVKARTDYARQGLTKSFANLPQPYEVENNNFAKVGNAKLKEMQKLGWSTIVCDQANYAVRDAAMKYRMALANGIKMSPDQFIDDYIADVICHEVGHCMGLRHNFVASTNLTTAQLGDPAAVKANQVAASVMDYTPTNVVAILNGNEESMHNHGVGPYDVFAIQYGYSDKAGNSPDAERFALSQIARNGGRPGCGFMTDEDADGLDPFVKRFDLAKDPVNYMAKDIQSSRKVRRWAVANMPRNGESYADRNSLILGSMLNQISGLSSLAPFVSGVVGNRNFRGDVDEKPTLSPVPASEARAAMMLITKEGLSLDSVDIPDSILNNLSLDYNTGDGNQFTAPIRGLLVGTQANLMFQLLSVDTIEGVLENQFKQPGNKNAYTIDEHYGLLSSAVFGELGKGMNVNSIRRELQASMIYALTIQAGTKGISSEIARCANDQIDRLDSKLSAAIASGRIDSTTSSHYRDLRRKIARFSSRIAVEQ